MSDQPLPGEHQANDVPGNVDWAKLNEGREKLKGPCNRRKKK